MYNHVTITPQISDVLAHIEPSIATKVARYYGDDIEVELQNFYSNKLRRIINQEKLQDDHTLPGFNYLGPGTKVITNLIAGVTPTSVNDRVAMEHDFDYVLSEDVSDIQYADRNFENKSTGLLGLFADAALAAKSVLGYDNSFISELNLSKDEQQLISDLYHYRTRNYQKPNH